MRTVTGPQLATINAPHLNVYHRLQVEDATGTFVELTTLYGVDWVDEINWTEGNIDQSVMSGTVVLGRASLTPATGLVSLAPDMQGSPANIVAAVYAPLLASARAIKWQTAVTAPGVAPVVGDWMPMFWGKIDELDLKGDADSIALSVRDLGAWLLDTFIEVEREYSDDVGQSIESVMQQILDDNPQPKLGPVVLNVPVATGVNVRKFKQEQKPVMEALRDLAGQIGFAIRYRWQSDGSYKLTLYEPNRAQTVADWALGPNDYADVTTYKQGDADVRTRGRLNYVDHVTGDAAFVTAVASAPQIAKYGTRYFQIDEDAASVIDTAVEAQSMLDAAIADLSDIIADGEVDTLYFPVAETHDLGGFLANGVHYDVTQTFGVVQVRHALSRVAHRTFIQHRGRIAGGYYSWLNRSGNGTGGTPALAPYLQNFRIERKDVTFLDYAWDDTPGAVEVWVYEFAAPEPVNPVNWPPTQQQITAGATPVMPTARLLGGAGTYRVAYPPEGYVRFVQFEPRTATFEGGTVSRAVVYPVTQPPTFGVITQAIGATGSYANLTVEVKDPQNLGGILRAWLNRSTGDSADPSAAPDTSIAIASTPDVILPTDLWLNGVAMLAGIKVHVGRGKAIYFEFINNAGTSSGQQRVVVLSEGGIVDEDGVLLPGSIANAAAFAATIQPVQVFTDVVDFPASAPDGTFAYATAINKIFKRSGGAWDAGVDGGDIVAGSITVGKLAAGSVNASAIQAGAVTAGHIAVSVLSGISNDLGVIVAGTLNSLSGAVTINLNATGVMAVLSATNFYILADGTASFNGIVTSTQFNAPSARFYNAIVLGGITNPNPTSIAFRDFVSILSQSTVATLTSMDYTQLHGTGLQISATSLYLGRVYFASNPDLPGGTVSYGAADSGGVGYRLVLVPN